MPRYQGTKNGLIRQLIVTLAGESKDYKSVKHADVIRAAGLRGVHGIPKSTFFSQRKKVIANDSANPPAKQSKKKNKKVNSVAANSVATQLKSDKFLTKAQIKNFLGLTTQAKQLVDTLGGAEQAKTFIDAVCSR